MTRLSPQLLIAAAGTFVESGIPDGAFFESPRDDAAHKSWDLKLIHHCGHWAHFDHQSERSSWPLPVVETPAQLGAFGSARDVVYDEPEVGDIFLQYAPRVRAFVHAGIVVGLLDAGRYSRNEPYVDIATIEGDTDEHGRLGGGRTMRVRRRLSSVSGDRFLRWAELESFGTGLARMTNLSIRASARDPRRFLC